MSNDINTGAALAQMRQMALQASQGGQTGSAPGPAAGPGGDQVSFSDMLGAAVNQVNQQQMASGDLARAFELGQPGVDLPQVMIAAQKASLSFEALSQVRNHLVRAYEEINRMAI